MDPASEISPSQSRATSIHSLANISDKHKYNVMNVDLLELEDILLEKNLKMLPDTCKGHTLIFPNGKSPYTCYPFALHDTLILPWDFKV
jgi:hypothetical protein